MTDYVDFAEKLHCKYLLCNFKLENVTSSQIFMCNKNAGEFGIIVNPYEFQANWDHVMQYQLCRKALNMKHKII